MKILDLPVEERVLLGSAASRRFCRAGKIPANLYGGGQDSVALVLEGAEFDSVLKAHSAIVRLTLGGNVQTAIVREVDWDTFGEFIRHVDLMRVELQDEISISVPVHFVGVPIGASHGGVLYVVHKEIALRCRVDSIPGEISYDVTELELDDRVTIADLSFPERVRPVLAADELVAHVKEPRVAIDPTLEEGEEGAEAVEGEAPAEGDAPAEGEESAKDEAPAKDRGSKKSRR